uniref:Uncharacterized protein n=1 Tax=Anguilla anguilla TaxID=7936 RepID=A0A0E9QSR3_ANGAN
MCNGDRCVMTHLQSGGQRTIGI